MNRTQKKITASKATEKLIYLIRKLPEQNVRTILNELEDMLDENKRKDRIPYSSEVLYSVNGRFYDGHITNINANGIFIETMNTFSEGDKLTLSFELPGKVKYIKVTGKIAHSDESGIGVRFDMNIEKILNLSSIHGPTAASTQCAEQSVQRIVN